MKEVKLIVDGKEITAKISNDDIKMINNKVKKTGYERVKSDEECYHVYDGRVEECCEDCYGNNDEIYLAGNYYNDEQLASDVARAEILIRSMRQWQSLNDKPVDWNDEHCLKYDLYYNYNKKQILIGIASISRNMEQLYFSSKDKAIEAIKVFYGDLIWYFTEYRQRLDEPKYKLRVE